MSPADAKRPPEHPDWLRRTLVLIPALNEAESIGPTVRRWRDLGVAGVRVVDNGSSDRTASVAAGHGAEVVSEPARGYGAAAWRGLQDWPGTAEWVLFSSADGSDRLSEEEAWRWEEAIRGGADVVIGDRTARAQARAHLHLSQRLGNWLVCRAIRWGWGSRCHDMGSMRLIRRDALMELDLKDRGFGWNVEMHVRALEAGLRIVELAVCYHPRAAGQSKISGTLGGTIRAGWGICRMLGRLWRWQRTRRSRPCGPAVEVCGTRRR